MICFFVVESEEIFIYSGYGALTDVQFANISSFSVWRGGVLFDTHKFLTLMKSTLSVILLVIHAIGVPSKIHCLSKDMIQIYTFL